MSNVSQNWLFLTFYNILETEHRILQFLVCYLWKIFMHYMSSLIMIARYVKKRGFILQQFWNRTTYYYIIFFILIVYLKYTNEYLKIWQNKGIIFSRKLNLDQRIIINPSNIFPFLSKGIWLIQVSSSILYLDSDERHKTHSFHDSWSPLTLLLFFFLF